MSKFEHLTAVRKEGLRTSEEFFAQQVRERNPALFDNSAMWVTEAFELGLLYWAHCEISESIRYFELCIKANQLRAEQYRSLRGIPEARSAFEDGVGQAERLARVAGYFVGDPVKKARVGTYASDEQPGYEPWFEVTFIDACVDGSSIDADAFEQSKRKWVQQRFPASKLAEYDFYREVLEGGWSSRDPNEMLRQHEKLYAKRAKKKGLGDLIAGEGQFNDLVIDFLFAAILKRIGWQGEYRHAWPENGVVPGPGSPPVTTTKPSHFVNASGLGSSSFNVYSAKAGVESSEILARLEALVPAKHKRAQTEKENPAKVLQDLKALGIAHDQEFVQIATRYRLSDLSSPRQNAGSLSDPAGMVEWSEYFRVHHGMSKELVLLTAPIEMADWEEPEASQFVYSIPDGGVYLADVEDLADPARIGTHTEQGVSAWSSFGAFLLWYLGS